MVTATNQLTIVASLQDRLSGPMRNMEKSTGRIEKQFTKLSGAVQNAFQFYVRYRIFSLISQGISAVENAIPALINRGQEWAQTVDAIADATGLAAEKSSLLAGIAQTMTGDIEGLDRALGALANTTANHGDTLRRYGIETRTANGELLDTWTILGNVRRAMSNLGNGFITTAAARELFSRGGQKLLDLLTLSDAQFRLLTKDVKESGVIMSDAGLRAAEQWQRTQQRFELTVTGIANQITQNVQPLLSRLVDGIANYLRANMAQIVGFVTGVISFVAGAIAGFLGIDISGATKTFAEALDAAGKGSDKRERVLSKAAKTRDEQTSSEDGYTLALNRQIEAIDRQLAAMAKADNAEDARREHARLLADISAAQKELRDLRGEGIFAAGMSAAEAELARQAQSADIVEAQKKVRDAQKAMAEQERDTARENRRIELTERKESLQQRLADHMKALTKETAAERQAMSQIFGADKGGIGAIGGDIARVTAEARRGLLQADVGKQWGVQFRASLEGFFDDLNDPTTGLGQAFSNLASIAQKVADNWGYVVAVGVALVGINLAGSFLGLAASLTTVGASLVGALGFAGAVGIAIVAIKMWADALDGWMRQHDLNVAGFEAIPNKPIAERTRANIAQVELRKNLGGQFGGMQLFGSLNKGQEEESLARSIASALADKTVTKPELAAYAASVNDLINTMRPEGRGGTAWDEILRQQGLLNAALGKEGTVSTALTQTAARTATLVSQLHSAGGLSIAGWLQSIGRSQAAAATKPPGIVNMNLYLDRRLALQILGVPISGGNSTTRRSDTP